MKILYWSPFLTKIATVSSVLRSIRSMKKYYKDELEIFLIDSVGEWNEVKEKTEGIKILRLYDKPFFSMLPRKGFFKSRFSQLIIFMFSFFKLLRLLKNQNPDFLIAHLIVSLPLMLMIFLNQKTKLIIRISGLPKLNFFRKIYWRFFSKRVFKVTCPTVATYEKIKALKIFDQDKLEILYDPAISVKDIQNKKNEKIENIFENKKYIISIGRLTRQKNFKLLIRAFKEIKIKYPDYILLILGEGEEKKELDLLIRNFKLEDEIFLLGYKKNVYKYLKNSKCLILSSKWEDPGFVLLEASFLNIPIISSDCKNGPKEILSNGEGGFLFENGNEKDLLRKFDNFTACSKSKLKNQLIKSKFNSKKYTQFNHFLKLKKIISA
jgi:glycosyltransferase involved in cell wall biosynthesis